MYYGSEPTQQAGRSRASMDAFYIYENTGITLAATYPARAYAYENIGITFPPFDQDTAFIYESILPWAYVGWGIPIRRQ